MPRRTTRENRKWMGLDEVRSRIEEINREHEGDYIDPESDDGREWTELNELAEQLHSRHERLRELAARGSVEAGVSFHTGSAAGGSPIRSQALRANEQADFLPERAREHVENMIRQDEDPNGGLAQYTVALANRSYYRAFSKWFNDPQSGGYEWTADEREAVQKVRLLERSMVLGTDNVGGFLALPYELDPNVVITASYKDPMRQICRVETGVLNAKRFITSAGSTSSWDAEEVEVSDDSPVLAAVTITAKKGMTFIPVSFELYEDTSIAQQVGALFADNKANHESLSFTLTQSGGAGRPCLNGHRRRHSPGDRHERFRRERRLHQRGRAARQVAQQRVVDGERSGRQLRASAAGRHQRPAVTRRQLDHTAEAPRLANP